MTTTITSQQLAELAPFARQYQQDQADATAQRQAELTQAEIRPNYELDTQTLVRNDETHLHHADDATSTTPLTPRPTRINHELRRRETFCCHHWWPGTFCHYGNHTLMAK
jgi:hypothetical protein